MKDLIGISDFYKSGRIAQIFKTASSFTSKESPVGMQAVKFSHSGGKIRIQATDGFKLMDLELNEINGTGSPCVCVVKTTDLEKALKAGKITSFGFREGEFFVTHSGKTEIMQFAGMDYNQNPQTDTKAIRRLGSFPDIDSVIPQDYEDQPGIRIRTDNFSQFLPSLVNIENQEQYFTLSPIEEGVRLGAKSDKATLTIILEGTADREMNFSAKNLAPCILSDTIGIHFLKQDRQSAPVKITQDYKHGRADIYFMRVMKSKIPEPITIQNPYSPSITVTGEESKILDWAIEQGFVQKRPDGYEARPCQFRAIEPGTDPGYHFSKSEQNLFYKTAREVIQAIAPRVYFWAILGVNFTNEHV